jgi:predicted Zn finger-like uncharacterized protein
MLLKSSCPHCAATIRVKEDHVSKRVRCPQCKQPFEVKSVEVATAVSLAETQAASETIAVESPRTSMAEAPRVSGNRPPALGKLGRFQLREILGQGAFGRVYRAYDPQLDREVALKVPIFGPEDTKRVRRFLTEAKSAAKLRHPNIVPVYESGEADGQFFIAAQFVAGQTLAKRIEAGPVDFREAAEWIRALADALAYAHGEGIVHRDIKPENIMLDEKNQPQIMDFGLAKRTNDDSAMTVDGSILGTPAYMSPEQATGNQGQIGPHSDQYSLAVVMYELLCGNRPFEGPPHSVIAQVLTQEPRALRIIRPAIPRDCQAICHKAMSKESNNRYTSCSELSNDIARWLRGEVVQARPITIPERVMRWCRRNPVTSGLAGSIMAIVVISVVSIWIALLQAIDARHDAEAAKMGVTRALAEQTKLREAALSNLADADRERIKANRLGAELSIDRGIALYERDKRPDQAIHWFAKAASLQETEGRAAVHVSRTNFTACAGVLHPLEIAIPLPSDVRTLQFGADNDHAVAATGQGELLHVNLVDGEIKNRIQLESGELYYVAIGAGGRHVATIGTLSRDICLWDVQNGTALQRFDQDDRLGESLAFSESGEWLAIGGRDGITRVWDIANNQWIETSIADTKPVVQLAIHADSKRVVTGVPGKQVSVWQVPGGTKLRTIDDVSSSTGVAVGGEAIVTLRFGGASVFDPASGKVRGSVRHERAAVTSASIHPGGNFFATASNDRSARIWNCKSLKLLGGLLEHPYRVRSVNFSKDGSRLLTLCGEVTGPSELRVWTFTEHSPNQELVRGKERVVELAISPDGTTLAAVNSNSVTLYSTEAGQETNRLVHEHLKASRSSDPHCRMAFSRDGRLLARGTDVGKVMVWNTLTGDLVAGPFEFTGLDVWSIQFSPNDRVLFACGGSSNQMGLVECWDLATGERLPQKIVLKHRIHRLAFRSDESLFATGDGFSNVSFWDSHTMAPSGEPLRGPNAVFAFCWLLDGRCAVGYYNWTAYVWDISKGQTVGSPLHHDQMVGYLQATADKTMFCSSDMITNRIWDSTTVRSLSPPIGLTTDQTCIALHPSGDKVYCGYKDGSIISWTIPNWTAPDCANCRLLSC